MTVYGFHVDGQLDTLVDVDHPSAWTQATAAVHAALTGRPVQVEAVAMPDATPDVDWPAFNVVQTAQAVDDD